MLLNRLKWIAAVVLVGAAAVSIGVAAHQPAAEPPPPAVSVPARAPALPAAPAPDAPEKPRNWMDLPAQHDGIVLFLGTEIKEGEKVSPGRILTVKVGGEVRKYRRIKVGDKVEEGQLLGRLDDRLGRDELAIKKQKVVAAEANLGASQASLDEAQQRLNRVEMLSARAAISQEEVTAAKLTVKRYQQEVAGKRAAVEVARLEVRQAQTLLETYELRSRVRGTIKALHRRPGEAVKALEPVLRIEVAEDPD